MSAPEPVRAPFIRGHGVYRLYDGDEVVYVGMSGSPLRRIRTHGSKGVIHFDGFDVTPCATAEKAAALEKRLIAEHDPEHNVHHRVQVCAPTHGQMTPKEIRAWREKRGMSQADLARALSVAQATVSRWESGDRTPPPFLRLALASLE